VGLFPEAIEQLSLDASVTHAGLN